MVASWREEPLAAPGAAAAELMDTDEGRVIVSNMLALAQSGTYA